MNDMTAVLMPEGGIPVGVGYNAHNQYSDAAYSGSQVTNAVLGQTIGDNFQRLLGAYSTGDFSHFAFEGAAPSAYNSLNQSAKDAYTSIFGSDVISNLSQQPGGQVTGASGATGGTSYTQGQTTYPDPTGKQFNDPADGPPQLQIVAWLASNAIKMGIPPLLPIMAAITESHLCNLDRAHSDPDPTTSSEGFFQQQHQFYDALIPGYATKPDLQVQAFLTKILAKKSEFPGATNEATQNAENLGDWIQSVQLSGPNDYHKNYDKAKQLLNQSSVAVASGSGASAVGLPTQGSVRAKAVQNAQWMLAHTSQISYSQSGQRVYLTPPALPFSSDCSGSCISAYNWAIATTPGTTAVAQSDGYTGTMLSRLTHITADQASPGDMVVVGSGTGHHAIMLLNKVGNDWNCFSHGGPAGPHTTPLSYYAARDTITYLRWPGDIDKAN